MSKNQIPKGEKIMKKMSKVMAVAGLMATLVSPSFAFADTENTSQATAIQIPSANTWVSDTDSVGVDYFSFNGTPRGKITFSVKFSEAEYNYWQQYGENYISISVMAERKDGGYAAPSNAGVTTYGMPNQTVTKTITFDKIEDTRTNEPNVYFDNEKDFTGRYFIGVNYNHKLDPNFQVTASFEPIAPPQSTDNGGTTNPGGTTTTPTTPTQPTQRVVSRFGGKDRFEVNKQMTGKTADHNLDYVILADAQNYPDALASGVLNGSLNSATLLVQNEQSIINANIAEAKRLLKPNGKILIVGGPASVSLNVENAFKNVFPVERIGGKDRIEVSTSIAERVTANPSEIFLTYGLVFSDALSIVPYATKAGIPIILQYGNGLDSAVQAYIQKHPSIKKVTIVSGTGVIPISVETQLKSLGVTTVERVAGLNRYDTSLMIAQKYFANCTNVALANGYVFADALSGNQFAYKNNMPIILVENNNAIDATKTFVKNHANQNIFLYGGPATINDNIIKLFN
jgi:putative cell wall-binding protein